MTGEPLVPERQIRLKYASRCRRCRGPLAVGELATYNPATKYVACIRCPGEQAAQARPRDAQRSPSRSAHMPPQWTRDPAPDPGEQSWQRLVEYHRLAQLHASAHDPAPIGSDDWLALPRADRDVMIGTCDAVVPREQTYGFLEATPPDGVTLLGWPALVLPAANGQLGMVPLLVTGLALVHADGGTAAAPPTILPRDDRPYVNPALLSHPSVDPAISADLETTFSDLPFGDVEAMEEVVGRVCAALGHPLQASREGSTRGMARPSRPGAYDVAVLVRALGSQQMIAGLVDELGTLRGRTDWRRTAAAWLVEAPGGAAGVHEAERSTPVQVSGLELNDSQEQALTAALDRPLTVVTGPPGTGKSQLVAAIVANQWVRGRSVLVASTNNTAVDVAVGKTAAIDPALLLRTGSAEHRSRLMAQLESLSAREPHGGPSRAVIDRRLELAEAQWRDVLDRLERRSAAEGELAQLLLDVEQLAAALWAEPAHAPDAARHDKAWRAARRLERSRWRRGRRARALLRVAGPTTTQAGVDDVLAWLNARRRVDELLEVLENLGPRDAGVDRAELETSAGAWSEAGLLALRDSVQVALRDGRVGMQQLARSRAGAIRERTAAFRRVLPHVPGWATTALSARGTFPLEAGLFDLLVIDEASQCSIAQVLPLAYRARRIVVVGDPNQLTPIVTLNRPAIDGVARVAGASEDAFRAARVSALADSAFTAYEARAPQVHLLDEHYRCHPAIAGFFNEQFYGGALRILTSVDRPDGAVHGLHLIDVRGRMTGNANHDEVQAVVAWVAAHPSEQGTLGVVTPFREQRQQLEVSLRAALGEQAWVRRRVKVGTAHTFQGEERDVILFSTVLAADASARTARWVEDQRNLVNVAVSRAKRALVVVADVVALADVPVPTLHALVAAARSSPAGEAAVHELRETWSGGRGLHSEAERRLFDALSRRGVVPDVKPVVEGYELDFALDGSAGPVNLEVDGTHHADPRGRQRRQDLLRDAVLEQIGWRVVRVPAWRAHAEADAVAAEVLAVTREHDC